jgi:hypothetical protein
MTYPQQPPPAPGGYQTTQYVPPTPAAGPPQRWAQPPGAPGSVPPPTGYPQQQPPQAYQPANAPVPADNLPGWGELMSGGGVKALPTKNPDDSYRVGVWDGGVVVKVLNPRQRTNQQTGELLFWPKDGKPKMAYPVQLLTDQRDPSNPADRGLRTDYIQSHQIKAVKAKLNEHGVGEPEVGALLYRCLVAAGGPGTQRQGHEWAYHYVPPTPETLAMAQAALAAPNPAAAPQVPQTQAAPAYPAVQAQAAPQTQAAPSAFTQAAAPAPANGVPAGVDPAAFAAFMASQQQQQQPAAPQQNGQTWPYGGGQQAPQQQPQAAPANVPPPPVTFGG